MELTMASTLRRKMMNSSMGFLTVKGQNCPIKIKPESLEFTNVEVNQKYEILINIRNEGKQNEKIRIINPTTHHFTVKNQANPFIVAPGLSCKLSVFFHLQGTQDYSCQTYEDCLYIIGTSFKKQIVLKATKPNFKLQMIKCFKLGLVRLGKETRFSIPIKNVGKEDVQIGMMHSSSPSIVIQDSKIIIKKENQSSLRIKVTPKTVGAIQQLIYFPNSESIMLRGVCSEEKIQIFNKSGQILNSYNFGIIFVGQKIVYPFYIANNSSQRIQGLAKILNNNLSQYANFKIDTTKMTFVNRNNPKKTLEQQRNVVLKCSSNKFSINPYEDFQNKLVVFKQPSEEQLKLFAQQALKKSDGSNRQSSSWNTLTEISQILYIKIISIDQPIKIPLQFCPVLPKIQISQDKFQFFQVLPKQIVKMTFRVKNCNQKAINIKLQNGTLFYFDGIMEIDPLSSRQFQICFRPLIVGEYSELLKITLFDVWTINIKAFGQCIEQKKSLNKQNMKINLNKSASLQQIKSTRFLADERKKRKQFENVEYLKKKISQRTNLGFIKNQDLPIDLTFDACQNPRVLTNKKFTIKSITSSLFFDNDQYLKNLAAKRKALPQSTARLNIKEIIKFSQELTPAQLSRIQIKCDRLDFGSVFVGSLVQKQLVICNKNNKVILVELDLSNNESLNETKAEIKKVEPYSDARFIIKLKTEHLGHIRIPICYVINKQHMFQMDIVANVTLINLGFSTKQLSFNFSLNDPNFQKLQTLIVTNYGTTSTKFMVIQPTNKAFTLVSNKEQQFLPNSQSHVIVKYRPLEGGDSGQMRTDSDKMIVKVVGGAQNVVKCQGTVFQSKYSIKQTQINLNEIFVSMPTQNKLTIRNHSKTQTAISIQLNPPTLNQVISFDQKNFVLNSQQRKQLPFLVLSHQIKIVKGALIVCSRGGKINKIPVFINFCFPTVQVVGCDQVNLGNVHIMTNHFEREIILINRTKTQIKLEANKNDCEKTDYIIQFIAAQERVELTLRNTCQDSQKDQTQMRRQFRKRSICLQQNLVTSKQIKNPKNINKIITLEPGIQTAFKMKFIPKVVQHYSLKIPLFLHKALRQIEPIPQKIKCKAVQPLFYVNPYSLSFSNVIICENDYAHKKQFQIINPHDREVDWQISQEYENVDSLYLFDYTSGNLNPMSSQKVSVYFKPQKEGVYQNKIKLYSNLDKQIEVELEITGSAVCPRINFSKNLLILPVVPIKTESKSIIQVQNYGYQAVSISKIKFSNNFPGVDLRYSFLDGKLLSLAKKKLKLQVSFKSQIPVSLTTNLQIYDQFGDKIMVPVSATADSCILTTYPYLQMNNSTVILDASDNIFKLLVSKAFSSKNKQTNLSGSSAVTGNFIKKWCNYELNIHIDSFPDTFVQSRGQLLYEMIIKMANGRSIIKKPCFTSQDKMAKMLQLHSYYSEVLKSLQVEGAFLNHIRPEFLLNMNDYLLYMFHKGFIIEQDQFQCLSHQTWTVLFYQLCKLYFEPIINQKFLQKFNTKQKIDKFLGSSIYSESQISILSFLNQFIGQQKIINFNDQARIFEVIQRIIEKTFKISLGQDLAKLKINADSLMLHEFLILVSKFLYSHLQEFGLSMYLQPNDLFTMGQKQFVLFFISLMQNLVHFQTYSLIQFQSASGEKNEKIIQLQNPSKKKKLKYWIKLYGSNNFKICSKEIEIDPLQKRMIKITYHCKKNSDEQAQLILVSVKDEDYFTNAHSLNFIIKNALISKMVMKKQNLRVHIYDIKTINLDIQLPVKSESCEYDVRLIGTQFLDELDYPNYYLIQPGQRTIKNGKDKCQIKIAPLQIGQLSFKIILVSSTFQQYIYEFNVNVTLPNVSHIFKLQSLMTEKQEMRSIKIPLQNDLKEQCLKFHRQLNKQKDKKKKSDIQSVHSMAKIKQKPKIKYLLQFVDQSAFSLVNNFVELGVKQKNDSRSANSIEICATFLKPYRQYKSQLLLKNEELNDYRIYAITAAVTVKAKFFNVKMQTKARQIVKVTIPNKMAPFHFRLQKNIPDLQIQLLLSGELVAIFSPEWTMKQQVDLYVQNPDTFEQHIYKIKLEAKPPEPVKIIPIAASNLFALPFQLQLSSLKMSQKQISQFKIKSDVIRKHEASIKAEEGRPKIIGTLYPGQQEESASIKLMTLKAEQYYQFILNIKNIQVIDLGTKTVNQKIGQTQKLTIRQIDASASDFYFQYVPDPSLHHQIVQSQGFGKFKSYFTLTFKPTKEVSCQKIFKFKSNSKEYTLKTLFQVKKIQPINVPVIFTQNLQKKGTTILISNSYDTEGIYEVFVEDQIRFKIQNRSFQMKNKDKVNLKIIFMPKFIGDSAKSKLVLKSNTLPQLTYCLQGISKFKCKQSIQEIEGYQGIETSKQLIFVNEFNQKQRFRFQFASPESNFTFDQEQTHLTRDFDPGEMLKYTVKSKGTLFSQKSSQTRINVIRLKDRKMVKQYILNISIVKNLQDKKYIWECKARETLFQTIRLPYPFGLKQIKTDPEIQKYITFNIDEKNQSQAKVKFSPLKPIKPKIYSIVLISDQMKFRIVCHIKVSSPPVDDVITIKTSQVKQTGVAVFKLTNILKQPAGYRAYFEKNFQELHVENSQGILDPYGKPGTPITIKFKSHVNNKRVDDKLIIETQSMFWVFKVVGVQQKMLNF